MSSLIRGNQTAAEAEALHALSYKHIDCRTRNRERTTGNAVETPSGSSITDTPIILGWRQVHCTVTIQENQHVGIDNFLNKSDCYPSEVFF